MIGLEPITCWLQISCSANWATSAYIFISWFVISCSACDQLTSFVDLSELSHIGVYYIYLSDYSDKRTLFWESFSVTPTGIEPVLPPWKGDVLTAWPWGLIRLAPRVGLEPTTPRLTAECSTIELSRNNTWYTTAYSSSLTQIQVDVNTFYFMYLQNFIQKVLRLHSLQSLPLIFRTSQDKSSTY